MIPRRQFMTTNAGLRMVTPSRSWVAPVSRPGSNVTLLQQVRG